MQEVLEYNEKWAAQKAQSTATYFNSHSAGQQPKYFWMGCSDSRVVPNLALGLSIGDVFVYRNIANFVDPEDIGPQAAIQYAVQVLGVTDILVVGHTHCGGIKSALTKSHLSGPVQQWLTRIRRVISGHTSVLDEVTDFNSKV